MFEPVRKSTTKIDMRPRPHLQTMTQIVSPNDVKSVAAQHQAALRTVLAGLIGNVLEWFDFAVYGYFATDIGRQFFPQSSASAQQPLWTTCS